MECGSDDWQTYINRKTGEFAAFRGDARRAVEDDDPPDAGWELEEWQDCKRVLAGRAVVWLAIEYMPCWRPRRRVSPA